ncbi:MAG: hypothetical protein DMG17_09515 [Acidobacteria bacterium]|nr:MAG: hypothetical protein AUH28_14450 [Acidobacteria bacterium 13_1_40CM_56_16]PYS17476.1 MAG: hypothetical protein DMG17_09515 [Acidobacteriota bacterium]
MKFSFLRMLMIAAVGLLWAAAPAGAAQQAGSDRAARIREEASKPTPRLADGHADLSGNWSDPPAPPLEIVRSADGKTLTVLDLDAPELDVKGQPGFKARAADRSRRPPYKPQFVTKQRELMFTASLADPGIHCYPLGVPRLGPPTEIAHMPHVIYFMYEGGAARPGQRDFRIIPIGGKHQTDRDPFPNGDSIAYWEGDTLVVDVVNIDPDTWLDNDGDFHDENLHVIERFTRKGDALEYDLAIEDPTIFTAPWKPVYAGARVRLGSRLGANALLLREGVHDNEEDYACVERDREHKVNNDRQ